MLEGWGAVEEMFRQHWPLVFGYFARRTGDRQRAEDLAADTFERAVRGAGAYRGESPAGWLLAIARNVLLDAARRKRLTLVEIRDEDVREESPGMAAVELRLVIALLPPRDRHLLDLLHVYGFTVDETASITGASPASIRTAAYRARANARRLLEER